MQRTSELESARAELDTKASTRQDLDGELEEAVAALDLARPTILQLRNRTGTLETTLSDTRSRTSELTATSRPLPWSARKAHASRRGSRKRCTCTWRGGRVSD